MGGCRLSLNNLTVISRFLVFIFLSVEPVQAFDYIENSSTETSLIFPINLTILETIGTISDKENNTIGNFSHYLIGFELYLDNYSFEIDDTSPVVEEYSYDPFGQRIKITRNDTANTTIYTPFKELMRIRNSTGSYDFTYVYQEGILVARVNPDGSKYFYHPDHLGSTTLITNGTGSVVENTYYSPYGETLANGIADPKLYTGQFKDQTNTYMLCNVPYKPEWGLRLRPDPIVQNPYNPQFLNRYSYALGNPYKYKDPCGKILETVVDAAFISMDIKDINEDPTNPWNYIALTADVGGAIVPIATGGRVLVKGAETTVKGNVVADIGKLVKHIESVANIASKGGDVTKLVTYAETKGGKLVWLEKNQLKHIGEHLRDFEKAFGSEFKNINKVKELVITATEKGTKAFDKQGRELIYYYVGDGKYVRVGIETSGKIATAYPTTAKELIQAGVKVKQ